MRAENVPSPGALSRVPRARGVIVYGLLIELGFICLAFLGDLRQHLRVFFVIYAVQFALMLLAYRTSFPAATDWGTCLPAGRSMDPRQGRSGMTTKMIFAFAVIFRITLLPTIPSLSDDIYRYGWEGRVQRAGWSPYEYPPSAPELAYLRDATYPLINHNDVPTIYPPLTQLVFRLGSYLSDILRAFRMPLLRAAILSQKLLFVSFDLLCLWGILELLKQRGRSSYYAVLYAWNPLVVLEFAGSGHNDSLGIFYLLIGLLCWERGKSILATLGLATSFLSKYFSILLVPFFLWKKRWKELGIWVLFAAAGLAPFCFCWMMVHGATHYAAHWQFNASLFVILDKLSPKPEWAKWAAAALLGVVAVALGRSQKDVLRVSYFLVSASLMLAPTVHPWYVVWLIPFLCFDPDPAFLAWNLTIILAYTVWHRYRSYGVWNLHPAVQGLEYFAVLAAYGSTRWKPTK